MTPKSFKPPFDLGSKVRDTVTGYTGTLVCWTAWFGGHQRGAIQSGECQNGAPVAEQWFDAGRLEVVTANKQIGFNGGQKP